MLTIDRLRILEFRGIRDLCIEPNGDSFIVLGPNGSGKSGVVDALDFALTGNIARLRGPGRGGVSLRHHGPHVLHRDDPGSAVVELKVTEPHSGKSATLSRSVADPKSFKLEPDVPEVRDAVDRVALHPELVLSRREIIQYVLAEPGKRSEEIQALLRLERLGEIRKVLRSAQTKTKTASDSAAERVRTAEDSLRRHIDTPELLIDQVRESVNLQRLILDLDELPELRPDTDLAAGVASGDQTEPAFNKSSAAADIAAARAAMDGAFNSAAEALDTLQSRIANYEAYDGLHIALASRSLVESGLGLVDGAVCPLCDTRWTDQAALEEHLREKLRHSEDAASLDNARSTAANAAAAKFQIVVSDVVVPLAAVGKGVGAGEANNDLDSVRNLFAGASQRLASIVTVEELDQLRTRVESMRTIANDAAKAVSSVVDERPDQSGVANAHSFVTIAQERWSALRQARSAAAGAVAAATAAKAVHDTYCAALDTGLASIYADVGERFAGLYRCLNAGDEDSFKANLSPSGQKLDLSVDFYGQGMFPPAAYHSEGHQDGMGVCLYLALMERQLEADFRLAVLDDVVMSVDVGHRHQFCSMLKSEFPDVQFIVTTHDEVWARKMVSSGLVAKKQQARFVAWNVNDGPSMMEGADVWERIGQDLNQGDVNAAAARLRRNMEQSLAEIAEELGAQVPYRASGGWGLGEFLNAVKARYGKLLKDAARAANSWNNEDASDKVKTAQKEFNDAKLVQESESWAVNPAVHYNQWENFGRQDFEPVVGAGRAFLAIFTCEKCESWLHLSGQAGSPPESLRCGCGHQQFSLVDK
ncbi:AAA family ATPase [Candidatus Poriferisodalis sp.]|uniref:ATP-binding protein n=1 Tax=Candidatus Poriferisodalis sp. TaxID=3101277 RepID=UPI003D0AB2E9